MSEFSGLAPRAIDDVAQGDELVDPAGLLARLARGKYSSAQDRNRVDRNVEKILVHVRVICRPARFTPCQPGLRMNVAMVDPSNASTAP